MEAGVPTPEQWERIDAVLDFALAPSDRQWIWNDVFGPVKLDQYLRKLARARQHLERARDLLPDELAGVLGELIARITPIDDALPRDGRPKSWELPYIICALGALYHQRTGEKPGASHSSPTGPFLRFVSACLKEFAPEMYPASDGALGMAITRALAGAFWGLDAAGPGAIARDKTA
jgi:hypothetical protein